MLNWLSVVFPLLKERSAKGLPTALRWLLHILGLALVLGVGAYLNYALSLDRQITNPALVKIKAGHYWLPVFLLLLYAAGWLVWIIWKFFWARPDESSYPEIDQAWEEACQALARAGISLQEVPLFFVLGRPETGDDKLFQAAQLQLVVPQTPAGKHAPLHVYATRDAIYVTCPGASLLGKQASILALEGIAEQGGTGAGPLDPEVSMGTATVMPQARDQRALRGVVTPTQGGSAPSTRHRRALRRALGFKTPNLLHDNKLIDQANDLRGALGYLCRLIVRDRRPECPLNGLLLLLPLGGTDTEAEAQLTADILQEDLKIVRRAMKLHCPVFALICDMETIPGFREFAICYKNDKQRRIGQRFPLESPDVQGEKILSTLDAIVQSFCFRGMRNLVYPHFDVRSREAGYVKNERLFLLLNELRPRKEHLGRILKNGVQRADAEPLLFGGCYIAATGSEDQEQAFVRGVLKRLTDHQSSVRWTEEALAEDQKYRQLAALGYCLLGMFIVLAAIGLFSLTR